jgi:hypothetical protein
MALVGRRISGCRALADRRLRGLLRPDPGDLRHLLLRGGRDVRISPVDGFDCGRFSTASST